MDVDAPPIESGEDFDTYFDRTTEFWLEQADEMAKEEGIAVSDKQLKKAAKNMAKEYYEEESWVEVGWSNALGDMLSSIYVIVCYGVYVSYGYLSGVVVPSILVHVYSVMSSIVCA